MKITRLTDLPVTVTDETSNTDSDESASFTVVSGSPEVESITLPTTLFAEKDNTISASVTDPSGNLDEVQFQYDGPASGTSWADIGSAISVSGAAATASISWRPTKVGNFKIQATVTDESDNEDSDESVSFTVISPQPVPESITLPATAEKDSTITIAATARDPDGNLKEMVFYYAFDYETGDPWTRLNSNPIAVSGSFDTASVNWTPAQVGTASFHTTVEDHDGYRHDSALGGPVWVVETVEVVEPPTAPVVESISVPLPVYKDRAKTISAVVTDVNGDLNEVQFQYDSPDSGTSWVNIGSAVSVSGSRDTPSISWTPAKIGTYTIKVIVSDDSTSTSNGTRTLTRTVEEPPTAPVVESISVPLPVYKDRAKTISAVVTDVNGDLNEVQFQYDSPDSGTSWVNIGSAVSVSGSRDTPSISWTPAKIGTYTIKVIVSDDSTSTSNGTRTLTRTVEEPPTAPVVESISVPLPVYKDRAKTISAVVTDINGDLNEVQFQYDSPDSGTSWVNIGSAVSVSGSRDTPSISWTPAKIGTYTIKVIVSDDSTSTSNGTRTLTRTVEEPPTAPVVESISVPLPVYKDRAKTISAVVTDINGDLNEVQFQYDSPDSGINWMDIGSVVSVSGSRDTASVSWTPTQAGSHKIKVIATDEAELEGTRTSTSFTVEEECLSIPFELTIPPTVYKNQANTLSASVTDPCGRMEEIEEVQFQYDSPAAGTTWVDIGSAVTVSGTQATATVTWTPTQTGTYKIRVTVTYEANQEGIHTSNSFEVVEPPTPPVAVSVTPPSPDAYINQSNTISAVVADINGDLQSVQFQYSYYDTSLSTPTWTNWDDGNIGSAVTVSGDEAEASVTWTPTILGTYKIRYIVTDAAGNRVTSDESPQFTVVSGGIVVSLKHPANIYQNYYNYLSVRVTDASGNLEEVQFQYDGPSAGTAWVDIGSAVPVTEGEDTAAVMWKPTVTGAHKIKATVTNTSGNSQSAESSSLTVVAYTGSGSAGTAPPHMVQGPLTIGNNQTYDVMHASDIATSGLVTIENGGQSIFWSGGRIVLGDGFSADPTGDGFFNAIIDRDMDGLSDLEERALGTSPTDYDTDDDGFSDGWENLLGFNPNMKDVPSSWTDNDTDGMPDSWEDYYSAKSALDSFWEDYDGDGLLNYVEFWVGTDPGPAMNGDSIDFDTPGLWKSSDYLDAKFPSGGEVLLLIPDKGVYSMDETNTESTLSLVTDDL